MTRKEQTVEALGVVRAVKPRMDGRGILGLEQASYSTLERWIEQSRRERLTRKFFLEWHERPLAYVSYRAVFRLS